LAPDSSLLSDTAVVLIERRVFAEQEVGLRAITRHVIQEKWERASGKVGGGQ